MIREAEPCPGWKRPCGVLTPRRLCYFCSRSRASNWQPPAPRPTAADRILAAVAELPLIGEAAGWNFVKKDTVLAIIRRES